MEITIIAAMAENGVIGRNNALPWSLKADLARFKELTLGSPCIMGRKTWESLPKRPLPGRPNIVVSTLMDNTPGASVVRSLQEAIRHCGSFAEKYEKVFICGGASIYQEALAFADKIELTLVHGNFEGDVFFPKIDPAVWTKTGTKDFDRFSLISYSRMGLLEN